MSSPLVSIITVVYNGAATLETTILSVIRQSYSPIEYILVDGGSNDGTLELIDRYKKHIAIWVSEPDKGIYDAMNKGVRMAKGDWVFFLGSDDQFQDGEVLSTFFSDPTNQDYDMLYGNVESPSYKGLYDGPFTLEKLLTKNISHQALFYKKNIFQKIGDYNLRYRMHADWDLNIRCFTNAAIKAKYVERTVANFGAGGVSAGHDVLFLREVLIVEKLHLLDRSGNKMPRSVKGYDEWWRLLRNAGIRDVSLLAECAQGVKIPAAIKKMLAFQRKIPVRFLRQGLVSKLLMTISYISAWP